MLAKVLIIMDKSTHYIECFEHVGKNKKRRLFQECKFIKTSKNGKYVVETTTSIKGDKVGNIRYIDKNRLIPKYIDVS